MKKLVSIILVSVMLAAVALTGCAGTEQPAASSDAGTDTQASAAPAESSAAADSGNDGEGGKYKVAYVARTLSDVFASWLASEMQKAAEEYSDTYTFDVLDSQGDPEKENSLLENCITQGYDCVIIQPNDGELQRPYAEKLVEAGIKVITTNAKIPDLEGASSVDADPYEQGAVLARDAAEKIPENGKIVILNCLPGNLHTTTRYKAFQEELLAKRPDIEVLGDQIIEQGSEADAMAVFEDWAQSYGTWDCTLTTSDALAQGFINMAKDNPAFENTLVYGVDGTAGGMLNVIDGLQTATCLQNAIELGELNTKLAYELLTGETEQEDYAIEAILVDSGNVDEYIKIYIDNGQLTEGEVKQHQDAAA